MSKSCKAVFYRAVFVNLIRELRGMWPEGRLGNEEYAVVEKALKQIRYVVKGYYWCNISLLVFFMAPTTVDIVKRVAGYDVELLLPFFYWLPFDPYQRPVFEILLASQFWISYSVVMFILSGDLLFFVFLNHITMQFDLLAVRIRKLVIVPVDRQLMPHYPLAQYTIEYKESGSEEIPFDDYKEWERRHLQELTSIIVKHRDLIRQYLLLNKLSEDVEELYSFALLINFFISSIIICFCGFCIAVVEEWSEPAYKIFLMSCLSQTWLLCWYGQRLIESSEGVSDALYDSGWYKASKRVKSNIIIMIYRTQKPVRVTTYGFSVISLPSYTTIIKTSWSYFTLLLKIYNKQ